MNQLFGMLDELMAFVSVVDEGGFNAAALRHGVPSSRLSRAVAALERRLDVSLLVRTSRRFEVTSIGRRVHAHGVAIRERMRDVVVATEEDRVELSGHLRVACPMVLGALVVGGVAMSFMKRHPAVRLTIESTDGRNRPFSEPVDLSIQPMLQPLHDSGLVARKLVDAPYLLVAAPTLKHGIPDAPGPGDFPRIPAVALTFFERQDAWTLHHDTHGRRDVPIDVRFASDNLLLVRDAAVAGVGVAPLPMGLCRPEFEAGRLKPVAPDWRPPQVCLHVLYPSRRALTPAGRAFIDALVEAFAPLGA